MCPSIVNMPATELDLSHNILSPVDCHFSYMFLILFPFILLKSINDSAPSTPHPIWSTTTFFSEASYTYAFLRLFKTTHWPRVPAPRWRESCYLCLVPLPIPKQTGGAEALLGNAICLLQQLTHESHVFTEQSSGAWRGNQDLSQSYSRFSALGIPKAPPLNQRVLWLC